MKQLSKSVWALPLPSRTLPPHTTTNCYLIRSDGGAAVVDPGFHEKRSLDLVLQALEQLGSPRLVAVLLTHTHPDHCQGLGELLEDRPEVPIGVHPLERTRVPAQGTTMLLEDGARIAVGQLPVTALHTPGHSPGHLCYRLADEGVVLAGDLVAGEGSIWVGVPEGSVTLYLASLERIEQLQPVHIGPGHGPPGGTELLARARRHRLDRELQVLAALTKDGMTLAALRQKVYPALRAPLTGAAEASLLAHLLKLESENRVVRERDRYRLAGS